MKTMGIRPALRASVAALAISAAAGVTSNARADLTNTLSDVVFSVEVSSSLGTGMLEITQDMGVFNGDFTQFLWMLPGQISIMDGPNVIATLTGGNVFYDGDPAIAMGFSIVAGNADTTVNIVSGTLGVGLTDPMGDASAGLTLTDGNGNGSSLTGLAGSGNAYRAAYNGSSTSFLEAVGALSTGDGGTDSNSDASSGGIGGLVEDMSSQFSFVLSANDQASGTSSYSIVPAPAALAVLAGGLAIGRRRRRD